MGVIDRTARRQLADGETLIASALGVEADGRRRQVVLVTDRRVLVCGVRRGEPQELALDTATASYDRTGQILSLDDDASGCALRGVDALVARQLVGLLANHQPASVRHAASRPPAVRVISG